MTFMDKVRAMFSGKAGSAFGGGGSRESHTCEDASCETPHGEVVNEASGTACSCGGSCPHDGTCGDGCGCQPIA